MNAPSPLCYLWLPTLTKDRTMIKRYIRISTLVLLGFFVINGKAFAVADPELPDEICAHLLKEIGAHVESCPDSNLTEENTKAKYEDLNGDGTKEVILVSGGWSCGSNYWVFKLNKKIKWENIGGWCGCDVRPSIDAVAP